MRCFGRGATTDGNGGFQPTVRVRPRTFPCRVATHDMYAASATLAQCAPAPAEHVQTSLRDETDFVLRVETRSYHRVVATRRKHGRLDHRRRCSGVEYQLLIAG